jgi:hypothetical protein
MVALVVALVVARQGQHLVETALLDKVLMAVTPQLAV